MGFQRIFLLYVVFLTIAASCLFFGIKILKRGQLTRQKSFIVTFFFFVASGLIINPIYAPFASIPIQTFGNKLVMLTSTMGLVNLMFFSISVAKSSQEFTRNQVIAIESIFLVLCLFYYLFPISFHEDFTPIWPVEFVIYTLVVSETAFVIAVVFSVKAIREFGDKAMKTKLRNFLIGVLLIDLVMVSTILRNGQLVEADTILVLMGLLIIPGVLMIYYSVGRAD